MNEFNYDRCIDFLQMCPDDHLTQEGFELIIAMFKTNNKKSSFYDGRNPTFKDVNIILSKLKSFKENEGSLACSRESAESMTQMLIIVRFVLQKAITSQEGQVFQVNDDSIEVVKQNEIANDMELIQILKQHQDLGIVDEKTSSLVLFELKSQLSSDKPFAFP